MELYRHRRDDSSSCWLVFAVCMGGVDVNVAVQVQQTHRRLLHIIPLLTCKTASCVVSDAKTPSRLFSHISHDTTDIPDSASCIFLSQMAMVMKNLEAFASCWFISADIQQFVVRGTHI